MKKGSRRRGVSPLLIVGLVALLVAGFAAFNAFRVLGEFFGSSGGSNSGHESPPIPAAPISAPLAADAAADSGELPALQRRVTDLEERLAAAVASGDPAARELQGTLRQARRDPGLGPDVEVLRGRVRALLEAGPVP